jgi:hypothetical protein
MRIGVAGDAIRQTRHAGVLRRGAPGEACACQVERSPKEVDGADLSDELSPKDGEDSRGLEQNAPEALREFGVIGLVRPILVERNGLRDLHRHLPDVDRGAEALERGHELPIKPGHGHGLERHNAASGLAALNDEQVIDEIEIDLENAGAIEHGRRGEAANGGIKRNVPAVVDLRRECEPDLTDDLHPELQRGAGVAPRALRQSGPDGEERVLVSHWYGSA